MTEVKQNWITDIKKYGKVFLIKRSKLNESLVEVVIQQTISESLDWQQISELMQRKHFTDWNPIECQQKFTSLITGFKWIDWKKLPELLVANKIQVSKSLIQRLKTLIESGRKVVIESPGSYGCINMRLICEE